MKTNTVTRGAVAGALAGMAMAMWSMIVLWLTGSGFWQPLNLIAHTFWRGAPLDAKFSLGAAVLGLVVHMMMSMMLGVVFAAGVQRIHANLAATAGLGMIFGIVIWLVMQYGVWRAVDADAANAFTGWVFGVGHAMYGVTLGLVAAAPATAPAQPRTGA
jgi:hypothetical protein